MTTCINQQKQLEDFAVEDEALEVASGAYGGFDTVYLPSVPFGGFGRIGWFTPTYMYRPSGVQWRTW